MKQQYVVGILAGLYLIYPGHSLAQVSDHLKCYKIKDPAARKSYTADLGGLVPEPGCVVKVPAKFGCVPTTKTNVQPPPQGGGGTAAAGAFLCYKVKCQAGTLPTLVANDQFGSRTVTPVAAKLLCAPLADTATTTTTPPSSTSTTTTQSATCGNNIVEGGEQCDGCNFASCTTCTPTYVGGTPTCSGTCMLDYSPCTRCDLVAQDCSAGQGCYPAGGEETVCATSSQNLGEDAPCQNPFDCAPGFACVGTAFGDRCKRMCNRPAGTNCGGGQTCVAVTGFPSNPPVGVCN